mmetsp:Transcript_179899/g.570717  ORF Transcript_179899/g.570717 Transcript_179899/m.570717 type:complete len:392 (+) Transcript_179899:2482-3657(+)
MHGPHLWRYPKCEAASALWLRASRPCPGNLRLYQTPESRHRPAARPSLRPTSRPRRPSPPATSAPFPPALSCGAPPLPPLVAFLALPAQPVAFPVPPDVFARSPPFRPPPAPSSFSPRSRPAPALVSSSPRPAPLPAALCAQTLTPVPDALSPQRPWLSLPLPQKHRHHGRQPKPDHVLGLKAGGRPRWVRAKPGRSRSPGWNPPCHWQRCCRACAATARPASPKTRRRAATTSPRASHPRAPPPAAAAEPRGRRQMNRAPSFRHAECVARPAEGPQQGVHESFPDLRASRAPCASSRRWPEQPSPRRWRFRRRGREEAAATLIVDPRAVFAIPPLRHVCRSPPATGQHRLNHHRSLCEHARLYTRLMLVPGRKQQHPAERFPQPPRRFLH